MSNPFFSVIIITYNRPVFLRQAIQSVLDQTCKDFELIIIDDHSTDDTKQVVASYQDERVSYFLNDHAKGQPGARNAGIKRSSGKWIAFLDDDDIWLPLKLEKQYEKIQDIDETVGFIYTGYANYDFDRSLEISEYVPEKEGWLLKDLLYKNYVGAICSVAVKKEVFNKAGEFDEEFDSMVDMEMWVRIAKITQFVFIKEKLVYIRKSNSDRISLDSGKKLNGSLQFWVKNKEIINRNARLHHRAASRVFVYAFKQGNIKYILKSLPWTLAGLIVDPVNIPWILRMSLSAFYRKEEKTSVI